MAITKVGTDVVQTNGSSKPLQFNHTTVSTTNGLFVVTVGVENANETGTWTITYGGNPASGIIEAQQGTGFCQNAIVAYWFQADLPSPGSNQVSINFSGTAGSLELSASGTQYEGVDQSLASSDTTNQTSGTTIQNDVTIGSGDLACSAVGCGNAGTFTHNASQVELYDYQDSSSGSAGTELIATGSLSALTSTFSGSVNRLARACAVFNEAAAGPSYTQASFRGKHDTGGETSTDWIAALNTNFGYPADTTFRIRFLVQETLDLAESDVSFQLQYNLGGAGWNNVTGSSSVARSTAGGLTEGGDTTQQIGSGTFVTPNAGQDETDGVAGGTALDFTTTPNQEVELEFCLQLRSADTSPGNTVQFRLQKDGGDLDAYSNTPTVTVVEAVYTQASFRGKRDTGSESSTDWIAAANTDWTQEVDANFRVRFLVQETADVPDANVEFQLQYNLGGAGWNDVNGSSSVIRSSAGQLTDGGNTTQQLGTGTFVTPNAGQDEANGLAGGASLDFSWTTNQEVELEYCVQLRSADTSEGNTVQLRLVKEADEVLDTYSNTPTITRPSTPTITSVGGDNSFSEAEEDVEIVGTNFYDTQGAGKVELCPSSTYGSAVTQSVQSWGASSILFDVVMGGLSTGINYLFVTNRYGLRNATGVAVTITAQPISQGLFKTSNLQGTITSGGLTTTAFMVRDE
jgi:hypothetical protein